MFVESFFEGQTGVGGEDGRVSWGLCGDVEKKKKKGTNRFWSRCSTASLYFASTSSANFLARSFRPSPV